MNLLNYKKIKILLLMVAFFSCKEQGEEEIYYLNEDIIGVFVVFWNQSDGQISKKIDEKRIYDIPKSGVLFTKDKMQTEWIYNHFYYINSNDQILDTIKTYSVLKYHKKPLFKDKVYHLGGIVRTIYKTIAKNGNTSKEEDNIVYASAYLIDKKTTTKAENELRGKANNIIDSIIKIKGWNKLK